MQQTLQVYFTSLQILTEQGKDKAKTGKRNTSTRYKFEKNREGWEKGDVEI